MRINSLNAVEKRQLIFSPRKQLETSRREIIFFLIHLLVCACICYQVLWRLIYSLPRVASEKKRKKKAEFPQRFPDSKKKNDGSPSKLFMKDELKVTFLQLHTSFPAALAFWVYCKSPQRKPDTCNLW